MLSLWKLVWVNVLKKHVFGSFSLNNFENHRLSFEDIFFGILDTYMKKMNPPAAFWGEGVYGKFCWLITLFWQSGICQISYIIAWDLALCLIMNIYVNQCIQIKWTLWFQINMELQTAWSKVHYSLLFYLVLIWTIWVNV